MNDPRSFEMEALAREREGAVLNDKYTIDRLLGVGGMAAVYSATHRNKKRCAVKILHRHLSADPRVRERFLREGYVANTVDHSGTVAVDDDDTTPDGSAYLVMELLQGETVEAMAEAAGGKLDQTLVTLLCIELLDVLASAHDKGIVHRDIKPENLFVHRRSQLKVLDFGIAKLHDTPSNPRRTEDGSLMGTPAFMPPEQAKGVWSEVDAQSDLWSVGATMYSLLTGELVHEGSTVNEALAASITRAAQPIRNLDPTLPPPLAAVIDKALKRDKSDRYRDAASMRAALHAAVLEIHGADVAKTLTLTSLLAPGAPRQNSGYLAAPPYATAIVQPDMVITGRWSSPPVTASQAAAPSRQRSPTLRRALLLGGLVCAGAVSGFVLYSPGPSGAVQTNARALLTAEERPQAAGSTPKQKPNSASVVSAPSAAASAAPSAAARQPDAPRVSHSSPTMLSNPTPTALKPKPAERPAAAREPARKNPTSPVPKFDPFAQRD